MRNGNHPAPESWALTTLGELVLALQYGYTASASHSLVGPKFLRITDLSDDGVDWSTVPTCVINTEDLERYRVNDGDIVFARTGSIEKAWRVQHPPKTVFASYLIRGRPVRAELSQWLGYFVRSSSYITQARKLSAGIGRANINAKNLAKIQLPLAPQREQGRIVSAIETHFTRLDAALASLERVQANLKRYRASVLKAAVEGRLVPTEAELARREGRTYEPASVLLERILKARRRRWEEAELAKLRAKGKTPGDDSWKKKYEEPVRPDVAGLPELPEGWCWARVEQLGVVTGGVTKNSQRRSLGIRMPYLRVANVYANELRLDEVDEIGVAEGELQRVLLRKGDLLIVEGNGSLDQIGRVALWDGSIERCIHQNHIIKARFDPVGVGEWTLVWLLSSEGRGWISRVASSTSGLHTLSLSKVQSLPVPVPPLAEMRRVCSEISRHLSGELHVGAQLKHTNRRCDRLRQSILKWAFDGKLVDQDPNDEPASVLLERIRTQHASRPTNHSSRRGRRNVTA